jgi:hypothetical protein
MEQMKSGYKKCLILQESSRQMAMNQVLQILDLVSFDLNLGR